MQQKYSFSLDMWWFHIKHHNEKCHKKYVETSLKIKNLKLRMSEHVSVRLQWSV
jgi:hypothetical protein